MDKKLSLLITALCAFPFCLVLADDYDKKLEKVLKEGGLEFDRRGNGTFGVLVPLESKDRTHMVFVNSTLEKVGTLEIREIWAMVAQEDEGFDDGLLRRLLEDASTRELTSWKLILNNEKETIVCFAKVPAYVKNKDLFSAIGIVAGISDSVEEMITNEDEF